MGIRDILLFLIVFGGIPFMLRSPAVGIMYWVWIGMANPHLATYGSAQEFPFAALVAVVTMASLVISRDKLRFKPRPEVLLLLVLVGWMTMTTLFALNPDRAWPAWERMIKVQLLTFVAIWALSTKRHVQLLVGMIAISVGYFGVKGGVFTLRTGGADMVLGPGGFLSENNSTGLAILMTIPLIFYFILQSQKAWIKWVLAICIALCAAAVLGSQSRGAFLAVCAIALFLLIKSPRRLPLAIGLLFVAPALLFFMPDNWNDRMRTIETYEQDASAMGRINSWRTLTNLANDRPAIGGGFECYTAEIFARYAPDPTVIFSAHSIYFQVLGEHGWLAFIMFLALWIFTWRDASATIRMSKGRTDLRWAGQLAAMLHVSLIGYLVGGAFLNLAYWDMPYYLLVAVVLTHDIVRREVQTTVPEAPPRGAVSTTDLATGR